MRKINVRDMCFYIASKWFFVAIIGVLFACVFGYKYYHDFKTGYELTDDMKEKLDEVYELEQEYQKYVDANEVSGILDMDTEDFYISRICYTLRGLSIDSSIYDRILMDIRDEQFEYDLIEKSGTDLDSLSIRYLRNSWSTELDDGTGTSFYFEVYIDDENSAEKILETAKKQINDIGEKYLVRETEGEWTVNHEWTHHFTDDLRLSNRINDFKSDMQLAKSDLDEAVKDLSEEERICYLKYYLNENVKINIVSLTKKAVAGFIVGVALVIMSLVCIYMFDPTVKTVEEIKEMYNIYLLGLIDKKTIKDIKTSWFRNKRYRFDGKEYVDSYVESLQGKVAILYDQNDKDIAGVVDGMLSDRVSGFPYLHTNSDIQAFCMNYDRAIIVISLNKMNYRDFNREIEVCAMRGINVEGFIAVV